MTDHTLEVTREWLGENDAVVGSVELRIHFTYTPATSDYYDKSVGGMGGWVDFVAHSIRTTLAPCLSLRVVCPLAVAEHKHRLVLLHWLAHGVGEIAPTVLDPYPLMAESFLVSANHLSRERLPRRHHDGMEPREHL